MDVRMPRRDGFSACSELKRRQETRLIPVVLMTGSAGHADRVRAIEAGADDFLTKPIDEPELRARERMKEHAVIGERLCGNLRVLNRVRPIVRHHHERLDGSGYPDGLRGDEIPRLAQIIGAVDVYDALTMWRPYKVALPVDAAVDELQREVDRGWRDARLVNELVTAVRLGDV